MDEVTYITDNEGLEAAARGLVGHKAIGIDVETTSLDPYSGRLRLIQLASPTDTYVIDLDKVQLSDRIKRFLVEPAPIKIAHNAKFDAKWIKSATGIKLDGIFDSFLASLILAAGRQEIRHSLEAVAQRYLKRDLDKSEQLSDWSGDLSMDQLEYAAKDAEVLLPLREAMIMPLKNKGLVRVAALEFQCVPAVADMELTGIYLDRERWIEQVNRADAERTKLADELQEMLSVGAPQQTLFWRQDINLGSHVQVKKALEQIGVPPIESTIAWKLKPLAKKYPPIAKLMEYRIVDKQLTSFGMNILEFINERTGRIHADFRQIGAATGRFSSNNPNIQQIPHIEGYRRCFRPENDMKYIISDYSQIELRILADFSGDPDFIGAFHSGEDLHTVTASKVFNIPIEQVTSEQRAFGKSLNFGVVYGIGPSRFSTVTGISVEEAATMIKNYFRQYDVLGEWLNDAAATAVATKYSRTGSGRLVEYTFDASDKEQRSGIERNGKNTPIQGTGADIVKRAMRLLHDRLDPAEAKIVNVVHDEIVVEVNNDATDRVKIQVEEAMREAGEEFISAVPIEVSTSITDEWVKA